MTDSLASGKVLDGTKNAANLADCLTRDSFWRGGHCGIAIANNSGHVLTSSGSYCYSGYVDDIPVTIDSGKTGLITARKTLGSYNGTAGVLTFDIQNIDHASLQIMWSVPFYTIAQDIVLNIAIGPQKANKWLYSSMISNTHGTKVRAVDTSHLYAMAYQFKAIACMGDKGPAPLVVLLSKNPIA